MALARKLPLLAILVVALFGCKSSDPNQQFVETCTGGYLGNRDLYAPLVCVSVSGSAATPLIDPVHVYPKGKHGKAAQIVWAASDPHADLHIAMKGNASGCVKEVHCPRKQACVATIVETAPGGTQCEYNLSNGGGQPVDPIIIIDSCCPDPPPPV